MKKRWLSLPFDDFSQLYFFFLLLTFVVVKYQINVYAGNIIFVLYMTLPLRIYQNHIRKMNMTECLMMIQYLIWNKQNSPILNKQVQLLSPAYAKTYKALIVCIWLVE